MRRRRNNADATVGLTLWLTFIASISAYILLGTRERGSGYGGEFLMMLGLLGGGVASLTVLLALSPLNRQRAPVLPRLLVAASFFALIIVHNCGRHLYRLDQADAKRFIEQRLAEISASGHEALFPATQDEFINARPLPRLLRGEKFYVHEGGNEFNIFIRVDFDGGWVYSSRRPTWMRSS